MDQYCGVVDNLTWKDISLQNIEKIIRQLTKDPSILGIGCSSWHEMEGGKKVQDHELALTKKPVAMYSEVKCSHQARVAYLKP